MRTLMIILLLAMLIAVMHVSTPWPVKAIFSAVILMSIIDNLKAL